MKESIKSMLFLLLIFAIHADADAIHADADPKMLSDLYKTGKILLRPELVLDDQSMPKGVIFESPFDIEEDPRGNVYVLDYRANNIKIFSSEGKFINTIGRQGQGPGDFNGPFLLAVTKDRIYVWDFRNRRICVLTHDGEFILSKEIPKIRERIQNIKPLPNGDVIVEKEITYYEDPDRPQECKIELYSADLEYKKTIYSKNIWRTRYIKKPELRNIPQPYPPLVYWDVSPRGQIILGYSEKYEIEIYDSQGTKISSFAHSYEPVKMAKADKDAFFKNIVSFSSDSQRKQGASDSIVKNTKFPNHKPAFQGLLVDSEGNILVYPYREKRTENYRFFDAFDPDGKFIGHIQIVGEANLPWRNSRIVDHSFWAIKMNSDESQVKIVRYQISSISSTK